MPNIKIIGGGLAGSEAALQLADSDWNVTLYEMRPHQCTEAHSSEKLAEVVCSNSFKSKLQTTASGLLKAEMQHMGCKLLPIAQKHSVPAGNALAINRSAFAAAVTKQIEENPNIQLVRREVTKLDDELTILASGPLTSMALTANLQKTIGQQQLYFFDAIAPIVETESLDLNIIFSKSRYQDDNSDYLNCPFSKEEYYEFVEALNNAEKHEAKEFENRFFQNLDFKFYENCTPIEELARRGKDTLRFGVMRPVGLQDPRTGRRPYAVIQLRAENQAKTAYNLVGCQTMLKYGQQKQVLQKIPGLQNAKFLRYGSIHRNTFLNSPEILKPNLSLKNKPNIFVAGQLSGLEGYVESILSGLLVSKILTQNWQKEKLPTTTISRNLWEHLLKPSSNFQPMNANFGLVPPLPYRESNKKLKKQKMAARALAELKTALDQS
ncbi:MAG TPA: methylenetetrahydrofolate--tRNA-(uracil(54)-C(5))-methyltransferase (FADH(2)-oxidizing) TrmFO [Candidatus Cloacimonas sp.]|jgi:methylenetetrahydrofolate--tRNA-(uracil-5-)-methyltransferase|nr:methylenetetrahydrofolate--tRNA-(uracil(54)-C(5))-methyltransferase (FADH(2)-oxidizing) TrmFO [Candidatus Cloacimonas sp.]